MTSPLTLWDLLEEWERDLLVATPLGVDCFYCNTRLPTEADHAQHFQLADRISTSVGYCPNKEKSFK
ncbi:hypothetical protein ACGFZC_16050 [[Kitasatospora] papulosa]|uniref:hypothetical protein n=1 Tax=[Kitasatospora] papulosa TaxID=1464011 RepID=UPI00371253CE